MQEKLSSLWDLLLVFKESLSALECPLWIVWESVYKEALNLIQIGEWLQVIWLHLKSNLLDLPMQLLQVLIITQNPITPITIQELAKPSIPPTTKRVEALQFKIQEIQFLQVMQAIILLLRLQSIISELLHLLQLVSVLLHLPHPLEDLHLLHPLEDLHHLQLLEDLHLLLVVLKCHHLLPLEGLLHLLPLVDLLHLQVLVASRFHLHRLLASNQNVKLSLSVKPTLFFIFDELSYIK